MFETQFNTLIELSGINEDILKDVLHSLSDKDIFYKTDKKRYKLNTDYLNKEYYSLLYDKHQKEYYDDLEY